MSLPPNFNVMVAKLPTASPRIYTGQQSRSGTGLTEGGRREAQCNNYNPWESILLMSDALKLHTPSSALTTNCHGTANIHSVIHCQRLRMTIQCSRPIAWPSNKYSQMKDNGDYFAALKGNSMVKVTKRRRFL